MVRNQFQEIVSDIKCKYIPICIFLKISCTANEFLSEQLCFEESRGVGVELPSESDE